MSAGYGRIAFTDDVQREQERHGSARFYSRREARRADGGGEPADSLSDEVRDYLAERDSFYLASVGSTGWPYVQFRGGPPGFLRVLDEHRIGWADFRGNLQYVTDGNVHGDDRVALIVMDYPTRRRLKVYGRAITVSADEDPETVAALVDESYDAVVEGAVVVTVAAYDWNCHQHIRPRYTLEELQTPLDALRHRLAAAEAENAELRQLLEAAT